MNSTAERVEQRPSEWLSRRLWSLRDMLHVNADAYIRLGNRISECRQIFGMRDAIPEKDLEAEPLKDRERSHIRESLTAVYAACEALGLETSRSLLSTRLTDPPQTGRELEILIDAVFAEMKGKLFLYIPPHKAKYFGLVLPSIVTVAFPTSSQELILAGNCIAADLATACVFHSMRAVEIGVQAMGHALGVTFSYPIELAEWGKIVGEIEEKINELKKGPRSLEKDENLRFYSEAASQFRHFNNGWRIRASHARASYEEPQAITVFDHALSFFQTLATRLREPGERERPS